MIDTLFFALQIIGIVILIGWAVVHDRLSEGALSSGPLAFKQDGESRSARSRHGPKGSTRSRLARHPGGKGPKSAKPPRRKNVT